MKFRRRRSPLLLFLLPSFACFIALATADAKSENREQALQAENEGPAPTPLLSTTPKVKADVGTKDAPVDGLDGKPHAGPWVGTAGDKDKPQGKGKGKDAVTDEETPRKKPLPKEAMESGIPESNNGVMDDPDRVAPKKGTTGTEGGVSEKDRNRKAKEDQTGAKTEKMPIPPEEKRPLPHSEEVKIKEGKANDKDHEKESEKEAGDKSSISEDDDDTIKEPGGLAKPADLPDKIDDGPLPVPPSSKDGPITPITQEPWTTTGGQLEGTEGLIQPFHSFILSMTMILFSEIGDKTFLIAALMAMKHPRLLVFSAAFSALIAMTILSAVLGHALPTLIPKKFTNFLAAGLFLVFGARLLREGYGLHADEGVGEEMKEVELELAEKEHLARQQGRRRSSVSPYILESGRAPRGSRKSRSNSRLPSPPRSPPSSSSSRSGSPASGIASSTRNVLSGLNNLFSLLLSPAWVQTFVMTFLGEWGDRSQIATIAMAAGQDYWWVTGGAVSGHAVCTAVAVIGGRAVAGRVSLRVVTLGGGFAFLGFGVIYLAQALYYG